MKHHDDDTIRDPLGLGALSLLSPGRDGWPAIRAALEADAVAAPSRRLRGWAIAASVLMVLGLAWVGSTRLLPQKDATTVVAVPAQPAAVGAAVAGDTTLPGLIAMSQALESRVRVLRNGTSGLPARAAVYTAELEDTIARVDGEISLDPESLDLWAQRVNLLLDLQYLYQHQFDREYGRMAAL